MAWTKGQFVEAAFENIGMANYNFDLTPELLQSGLRQLDAMLATWNAKGIHLGYPIPSSPQNSTLDQEVGVPDKANEAIYLNLAMRLCSMLGKQPPPPTMMQAKDAYDQLLIDNAMPLEVQMPGTMPAGAGNRRWNGYGWNPFLMPPCGSGC